MKHDLRYKKTEDIISSTFENLLESRGMEALAISELCENAQISRNTFYAHYYDKYDLLNKYTLRYIDEIVEKIESENKGEPYENTIKKTAFLITQYLSENGKTTMLLIHNNPNFWNAFIKELQSLICKYSNTSKRFQIYASYSAGALVNCLSEYFIGNLHMSQSEFVAYIIEIAMETNNFMKKQL